MRRVLLDTRGRLRGSGSGSFRVEVLGRRRPLFPDETGAEKNQLALRLTMKNCSYSVLLDGKRRVSGCAPTSGARHQEVDIAVDYNDVRLAQGGSQHGGMLACRSWELPPWGCRATVAANATRAGCLAEGSTLLNEARVAGTCTRLAALLAEGKVLPGQCT